MDPFLSTRIPLSDAEFNRLSAILTTLVGIDFKPEKKSMLESRFQRRLRELQITSFTEYLNYIQKTGIEGEKKVLVRLATTNTTHFFREAPHFSIFTKLMDEYLVKEKPSEVKIWCAGCSSGEEAWSLAVRCAEATKGLNSTWKLLGTDVDDHVLQVAQDAIYPFDSIKAIPLHILKAYFLKSKYTDNKVVAIKPQLRERVSFKHLNFIQSSYPLNVNSFFAVFCRNVLIYFNKENQKKIVLKILKHIEPNGYLFTGHSESLTGLNLPLKQIAPSVYQKI